MAALLAAVQRHRQRLSELRPRVLVGELGGACGTLASLQKGALETQDGLMKELELELGVPDIAWHTVRDSVAEVGCQVIRPCFGQSCPGSSFVPTLRKR